MTLFRNVSRATLLGTAIISLPLILGACGDKDKGEAENISPAGKVLAHVTAEPGSLDSYLEVKPRNVSAQDADTALKALNLGPNSRHYTWDNKTGKNGTYTFTNLKSVAGDSENTITANTLTLTGVRLEDDAPVYDRLDATRLMIEDSDSRFSISELSLSRPTPDFAQNLSMAMQELSKLGHIDDAFDDDGLDIGVGALRVRDAKVTSDDITLTLAHAGWGEDAKTEIGLFDVRDVELRGETEAGIPLHVQLENISGTGIDMKNYAAMKAAQKSKPRGILSNSTNMFPANATPGTISMGALSLRFDTLDMSTDGLSAVTQKRGDILTTEQVMSPMSVTIGDGAQTPALAMMSGHLSAMGYDSLVLTSGQTSIMDMKSDTVTTEDSFFEIQDAFRINYDYAINGVNAFSQGVNENEDLTSEEMEALMNKMTVSKFDVTVKDNSILERGFKRASELQGTSPKLMKMQAKSLLMLAGIGARTEAEGAILTEVLGALGTFVEDGGTLRISLNPETPLPLGALSNLQDGTLDSGRLGLSATVEN